MRPAVALEKGTLLRRYKRFLADVKLDDGDEVVVHCPNPGSMIGCAEPGSEVWLRKSDDPARRLSYTWVLTRWQGNFICVDTLMANRLIREALEMRLIPKLSCYNRIQAEHRLGDSRFDFCLSVDEGLDAIPPCIVEVKSTTLAYGQRAMFPDAKTERGRKHLRGLIDATSLGYRAVQFYCIARGDVSSFSAAAHIDREYAVLLHQAISAGVEVMCWTTSISQESENLSARLCKEIETVIEPV